MTPCKAHEARHGVGRQGQTPLSGWMRPQKASGEEESPSSTAPRFSESPGQTLQGLLTPVASASFLQGHGRGGGGAAFVEKPRATLVLAGQTSG